MDSDSANMIPSHILIEHHSGYRLGYEEALAKRWGIHHGADVSQAALSQLQRNRVSATDADLVVGSIPFVKAALKQRGAEMPVLNCYPDCLTAFLNREIEACRLHHAILRSEAGETLFVKPSARLKRFTGFLLEDRRDPRIAGVPLSEPVYASPKVTWLSEWRCYVARGQIKGVSHYSGDARATPDMALINEALNTFTESGVGPAGYAMDFGVLVSGETALVEVNDGFGVGAYADTPEDAYMEMLIARWNQLVAQ